MDSLRNKAVTLFDILKNHVIRLTGSERDRNICWFTGLQLGPWRNFVLEGFVWWSCKSIRRSSCNHTTINNTRSELAGIEQLLIITKRYWVYHGSAHVQATTSLLMKQMTSVEIWLCGFWGQSQTEPCCMLRLRSVHKVHFNWVAVWLH